MALFRCVELKRDGSGQFHELESCTVSQVIVQIYKFADLVKPGLFRSFPKLL